ncbi:MAG: radical SAM family heme chaperone HemW [Pseudobdellovibrio sp.]
MSEQFGIYIHIPYCIQRCSYCDFATYVQSEILAPAKYVELLKREIPLRKHYFGFNNETVKNLSTLYFGGGTPSLIDSQLIVDLITELNKHGFVTRPDTEITLEINPATVDERKLEHYLSAGVNRFSVGAQTFHDRLLKMVKREHNSKQTLQTLDLLKKYKLNFSFDLLFALPTQTLEELKSDVDTAVEIGSKHISPYCLTIPESHPLSKNRPLDDEQLEMFNIIHQRLTAKNFNRYEISNYSLPGYESRHNQLYWQDQPYWGLGLSAHSYSKTTKYGHRFWNPNNINIYEKQIQQNLSELSAEQIEILNQHQALTDFCHTSLRIAEGISLSQLTEKFDSKIASRVLEIAKKMVNHGLIELKNDHIVLTDSGIHISNQIFEKFTFLDIDI